MSLSLPGIYLYNLSRDNLPPEDYERIVSAYAGWSRICREYEFDDGYHTSRYIINMRESRSYHTQASSRGSREKEKLEKMVFSGDVVMLSDMHGPAKLFHINEEGVLICTDPLAFRFDGAKSITTEYSKSVSRRDYRRSGGKPRPTQVQRLVRASAPDLPEPQAFRTINSKSAGRLLAAGGIYNGNVEGFAKTAKDLGGDADKGFEQVMNDESKGLLITGFSIAAGLGLGRLNTVRQIATLSKPSTMKKANTVSDRHAYLNDKFGRSGDINHDINIRGNRQIVRDFMHTEGIPKEQIAYLEKGINLNETVSIESINKGKLAYQNQAPGNWQGNWYSLNKNIPPTKLGINPEGNLRGTDIKVPKVTTTYQSQQPVQMLRSTASPVLDTWSVPKTPFQAEGGGIQWFSTNKDVWSPKK
ncbi:polymorphic toxin type 46 domain-containing protein [Yersinia aldovae]|uniref:polymorphic toxin type 46 domain-containing protein n=1 Tax=Yersinia aldovae TaxID=29483 RepID=UPI0005AD3557|nr:polymorphic toxin type 46 domain-containing protein [Yersinia aldovae]AJJ63521.1 toxin 61 family protein [Yersinia aldovae 670-83]